MESKSFFFVAHVFSSQNQVGFSMEFLSYQQLLNVHFWFFILAWDEVENHRNSNFWR